MFATTFKKKKKKEKNPCLVYFPLSSSQLSVSHQSNRRQLISFLWHTMMDLCYNPDLFWELQFLKLKAWMSHAWKGYWSDVDGQLKRNWYIPYSNFFFWPLHNVDFLPVCWHLKTLILWFNWYSSAASTQYFPVLFDVGVIYYPLPGMEKLVHCDKVWEFTGRQEPLTAHHKGTATNVGHFPILILPGAFQQM